ncbi:HigA family addiction module antitoxin [Rhizobium sp. YIM 134829]|uniref:HigA family addiction module antitoxin n=1 Tax=Rhizobium sp. YIM 134829 TaxID=3390453 RepID=UPI00397E106E
MPNEEVTQERCPSHPGLLLEEVIAATGRSRTDVAKMLGMPRHQLTDILKERRPISPAVAARLGKMFGDGAAVWLRMQAAHDAWRAERDVDTSAIPRLTAR